MADPGGFEPPTSGLEGRRHIQAKPRAHCFYGVHQEPPESGPSGNPGYTLWNGGKQELGYIPFRHNASIFSLNPPF